MLEWTSRTDRFTANEMGLLETLAAEHLITMLRKSKPLTVLRALAEVMLNGDNDKLTELLADKRLTLSWTIYAHDTGVDERDHDYARLLKTKLPAS